MHGQRPLACATSLVLEQDSHHQSLEYKSESSLLRLNIITTYKYNNKYENSFAVNQHLKLTWKAQKELMERLLPDCQAGEGSLHTGSKALLSCISCIRNV